MVENAPEFWAEAEALIRAAPIAFLATSAGRQPHLRAVTPAYIGLQSYIAAAKDSPMVRQIARNPRIELLHWTRDFRHLNIVGRAELRPGQSAGEVEQHFLYALDDFFAADRSNMSLIAITPQRIALTTLADIAASRPPRVWRAEG